MKNAIHSPSPSLNKSPRKNQRRYAYRKTEDFSVHDIVQSITNGMSLDLVDPELYSYIIAPLDQKKSQLIRENNIYAARVVNDAIADIRYYYYHQSQSYKETQSKIEHKPVKTKNTTQTQKTEEFSKEQIQESIQLVINEEYDQIDPQIYDTLAKELRKKQHKAIQEQNFQKASIYDNRARRLLVLDSEIKYNQITSTKAEEYSKKADAIRTDLSIMAQKRDDRVAEMKQKTDEDITQLRKSLQMQLEEFDKQYDVPFDKIPAQFKKYSSTYLNMRAQEKFMMKARHYQEALQLKAQGDALQRSEEKEFVNRYEQYLDAKRNDLIKRIEEQISAKESHSQRGILKLEKYSDLEIENSRKALKRFENHHNEYTKLSSITNPTAFNESCRSTYFDSMHDSNNDEFPRQMKRGIPQSARAMPVYRPLKSTRRDRRSVRTVRDLKTPKQVISERNELDAFKQRRAINNIMYTQRILPAMKKTQV